jgi:hypothetical protein
MNNNRTYIYAIALVATVFGILVALGVRADGQTNSGPRVRGTLYGLQTLAAGQTARASVVNRQAIFDGEIIPCIRVRVVFDVYETSAANPNRLRFVRRVQREVELDPGEAVSFDFNATRTGGERVSTSVFIREDDDNPPEAVRVDAVSTLEVRDGGRTIFILPGVRRGFDPQPDPPSED